ncbi:MAG: hypothetical protein KAT68_02020 [Bacteroidales bacterium]|nr:hypothetical protein [Bacteroidales bacterium]
MKTKPLTLIIFICTVISLNAQFINDNNYLSINTVPILGKTLELGYDANIKQNFSLDIYIGYVFNSKLSSPYKIGTQYELINKSGYFLKTGTKFILKNNLKIFKPFFGLNLVNAIVIEKGIYDKDSDYYTPNEIVNQNSYNLGINGIIGFTSPATKRINIDIGIQTGKILINNLLDFHSYMPGMGVNFPDGVRLQGILRIKYRMK